MVAVVAAGFLRSENLAPISQVGFFAVTVVPEGPVDVVASSSPASSALRLHASAEAASPAAS